MGLQPNLFLKHGLDECGVLDLFGLGRFLGNLALASHLLSDNLISTKSLGIRVESNKNSNVLKGVLALSEGALDNCLSGGANNGLDFLRVD